ncbi:hypothetical protein [Nonomuraea sp. NPDC048901]|uniref:hypothetical protein n=1 Tax=Nonomuraea sp. NPDC048901 TaxID=3155627 RepID=UPI0033EB2F60
MSRRWPKETAPFREASPDGWKRHLVNGYAGTEEDLGRAKSELASWSKTTDANLKKAQRFSWSAVAAGLAWAALVIPSDETLDRAVLGWEDLAWQLGRSSARTRRRCARRC